MSAQSQPPVPDLGFSWQDKVYHLCGYAVFGLLTQLALRDYHLSRRAFLGIVIVFGAAYALSDEWHQAYVPGRSSEFMDWMTDVVGILSSLIAVRLFTLFRERS